MRRKWNDTTELAVLQVETEFICDPQRRTVEFWHERAAPPITLDALRLYAAENKWHERRQAFWRGVQAAYLKQSHISLIRTRMAELKDVQLIQEQVHTQIKPAADGSLKVRPRSYEGMVRAYCALDTIKESKREAVLAAIDPLLAEVEKVDGQQQQRQIPFSPVEMRQVAHALLRARLKQRREELAIEDEIDDDGGNGSEEICDSEQNAQSG